jgi:hypothetical protein
LLFSGLNFEAQAASNAVNKSVRMKFNAFLAASVSVLVIAAVACKKDVPTPLRRMKK